MSTNKFIFIAFLIFTSLFAYGQTQDEYDNISHISIGGTHTLLNNKIFGLENTSIAQMNITYGHDWDGPNYRFPLIFSLDFSSYIPRISTENDYSNLRHNMDSRISFSYLGNVGKKKHFFGPNLDLNFGSDIFGVNNELYTSYSRGYFTASLGPSYQYETQVSNLPFTFNINLPIVAALHNWGFTQYTSSDEPERYLIEFDIKTLNQYIAPNLSLELDVLAKKSLRWSIIYNAQYNTFRYYSDFPWIHTFQQTIGIRVYYNPDWDNSYTW